MNEEGFKADIDVKFADIGAIGRENAWAWYEASWLPRALEL